MINHRLEFTNPTKREAHDRSGGRCECHRLAGIAGFTSPGCGRPLGTGNIFYEHIICDGLRKDNSLDNCAVLTKTCWKRKTAWDQPVVAKAKRVGEQHRSIWSPPRQVFPGSRRSPWIKHVNGLTERRPGR